MTDKYKQKDWLVQKYHEEGLSQYEIADLCDASQGTVWYWMRKHGVESETPDEPVSEKYKDREWLYEQYVDEERTNKDIAEECGVSDSTICRWKQKLDIPSRGHEMPDHVREKVSETLSGKYTGEDHHRYGATFSEETRRKMSEAKQGENNPWYGKSRPEFAEKMKGENNPSWKGGVTEDYDFRCTTQWQDFSEDVKERADWTCENCGAHGSESKLHTHHAHPVSEGGGKWDNVFIVLCHDCHFGDCQQWHSSTVQEQIAMIGGEPANLGELRD